MNKLKIKLDYDNAREYLLRLTTKTSPQSELNKALENYKEKSDRYHNLSKSQLETKSDYPNEFY
jgi:hypothetical protein